MTKDMKKDTCNVCKSSKIKSKLLGIEVCECIRKNYTLVWGETKDGFFTKLVKNDDKILEGKEVQRFL